jgi:hypothetical protein
MLIGEKKGTFTVIEELEKSKSGNKRFLLKCDCGAEVIKTKSDFKRFNRCKICSWKKYGFEQRGEFECIECNGTFSLEKLKKSVIHYYCCHPCRKKRERERIWRKKEVDKLFREKERIRISIMSSLAHKSYKSNSIAAKYLGVDKQTFMAHISSLFREGMSWENRSQFELDHVTPMSEAKTKEDIKKLWHYTNLQPLWPHENLEKSNRLDWREMSWAAEVILKRKEVGLE